MNDVQLRAAAQEGDINRLYQLINENRYILDQVDSIPFVDTPLHDAASFGHLQFAAEIMTLQPSFACKLNREGYTPIHLALEHDRDRVVLPLVQINKDLIRAKGRGGFTPLHLASKKGKNDLLAKFLSICPDSIEDVNGKSETALHIALTNGQHRALQVLVEWLTRNSRIGAMQLERTILNWKDEEGNTILHVAARQNDQEAIALLMNSRFLEFDSKNLEGQMALDMTPEEDIKRRLVRTETRITVTLRKMISLWVSFSEWAIRKTNMRERSSEEARNAYLVVATLVATATYQAALSPPGGLGQINAGTNNTQGHVASNSSINEGKSSMTTKDFISFSATNSFAFLTSTVAIIGLLPKRNVAWVVLYLSMALLAISYMKSVSEISPLPLSRDVVECIFSVLFTSFAMVVLPIFLD